MTLYYSTEIEQKLACKIREFLREKYRQAPSPVKQIGQMTQLPTETIKRWYKGRNLPKTGHLIILAKTYPEIMRLLLEETGYADLIPFMVPAVRPPKSEEKSIKNSKKARKNVPINVPIKLPPAHLNHRQRWFLIQLHEGIRITAAEISIRWAVTIKTAQRDIADLQNAGFVVFRGSRKAGRYELGSVKASLL